MPDGGANPLIADYILVYRNTNLAIVKAKKRDLPVTEGVGQAKLYAEKLDLRYTYSTNGEGIYQIDKPPVPLTCATRHFRAT